MDGDPVKKGAPVRVGIVLLVLILGGAAFVGGQLLHGSPGKFQLPFNFPLGAGKHQGLQLQVLAAPEIPTSAPAAVGTFIQRQNTSIFIGNGKPVHFSSRGGSMTASSSYASEIEVVIAHDTKIYRDVTGGQFTSPPQNGQRVQQVVQLSQIDQIGEGSTLQVWGEQKGDRIVAGVVLYTIPSFLPAGAPKP